MIPKLNHFRVDTSLEDRITVWIDVADRSVNVLFEAVFDELDLILDFVTQLNSVRPLLFRSAKAKGFVVGADLRRILSIESDVEIQAFLLRGQRALARLEEYPGNKIALIQGPCLGGGLELAMACRYRIAIDSPNTMFGMPEAKLGLMPGWGGTQRLIEIAGVHSGLPMLIDGESIGCDRALEIHLVDAIFDMGECETGVTGFIQQLDSPKGRDLNNASGRKEKDDRGEMDAWRSSYSGDLSASQAAIVKAIEIGMLNSREAGLQAERELFYPLLSNPKVREKLQRFAGGASSA